MPMQREDSYWRSKAEANLAQANKLLTALLWAAKELVRLSDMHTPDDFSHCPVCKTPWPCDTARTVRSVSEVFDRAAQEED